MFAKKSAITCNDTIACFIHFLSFSFYLCLIIFYVFSFKSQFILSVQELAVFNADSFTLSIHPFRLNQKFKKAEPGLNCATH